MPALTLAPLLPLASPGADRCADLYLARVAARSKDGAEGKAVREARRHLAHLAAMACSGALPAPAPRWPAGLPKLRADLSRVPFSRLGPSEATELRSRIYGAPSVAQGPRRAVRERDGRAMLADATRRPRRVRPRGHGAASVRVHHLRGVLRAAFESGAMDAQRYLACHAALRGA